MPVAVVQVVVVIVVVVEPVSVLQVVVVVVKPVSVVQVLVVVVVVVQVVVVEPVSVLQVVVVSLNYRVASLGFLHLGEEGVTGNAGLLDQVTQGLFGHCSQSVTKFYIRKEFTN